MMRGYVHIKENQHQHVIESDKGTSKGKSDEYYFRREINTNENKVSLYCEICY